MNEEEQKYFKGLIGFTFDSDDIKYIEKVVDKKDKEIERLNKNKKETLDFIERYLSLDLDNFNASSLLRKIREILDREEK